MDRITAGEEWPASPATSIGAAPAAGGGRLPTRCAVIKLTAGEGFPERPGRIRVPVYKASWISRNLRRLPMVTLLPPARSPCGDARGGRGRLLNRSAQQPLREASGAAISSGTDNARSRYEALRASSSTARPRLSSSANVASSPGCRIGLNPMTYLSAAHLSRIPATFADWAATEQKTATAPESLRR